MNFFFQITAFKFNFLESCFLLKITLFCAYDDKYIGFFWVFWFSFLLFAVSYCKLNAHLLCCSFVHSYVLYLYLHFFFNFFIICLFGFLLKRMSLFYLFTYIRIRYSVFYCIFWGILIKIFHMIFFLSPYCLFVGCLVGFAFLKVSEC